MRLRFWDKSPDSSMMALFPKLEPHRKKKFVKLHDVIGILSAIFGAGIFYAEGLVIAGYLVSWGTIASVIVVGLSIWTWSSGKSGKHGRSWLQSVDESGQLVNTRETSAPVKLVYGKTKVGGNWVFADKSVADEDLLNVVVTWSEGECEGIATSIDWLPQFDGTGYNDLHTGGEVETFSVCSCDETCYGYNSCSCNMTCYSETCDCNMTTYSWDPCICYNTFYSCNACYTACYNDYGYLLP